LRDVVPLELTLAPSRHLLRLAMLAYGSAIVMVALLLPNWRGAVLMVPVGVAGLLQWRQRFHLDSPLLTSGIRHDSRGWSLRFGRSVQAWQPARLLAPVFCHRHLVVLRFRCAGRWLPLSVAVTHDSCSADDFRRLRVLARHLPAPQLWAASR
jgi:hypothetical protein